MTSTDDASSGELPAAQPEKQSTGVVQAAAILAIGNVASRILGLAREAVKADLFGASGMLSAFEVAALVPTTLFDLIIGGIVSSALVPVFSNYVADEESRDELWVAVSTVLSVATVFLLMVVAVVELFTPQVAWLVGAQRFSEPGLTEMRCVPRGWCRATSFKPKMVWDDSGSGGRAGQEQITVHLRTLTPFLLFSLRPLCP